MEFPVEVVARALFEAQWRLRRWTSATEYTKNVFRKRAEEALKRSEQEVEKMGTAKEAK